MTTVFEFISSHKRSEAGLCSRPYPLQHGVRCHATDDASQDNDDGIQLKYRTDGGVFNLSRLLFADDCALNSNTEAEMQQCVNHISGACDNFGFTSSIKKTGVMHQPAPRKMYHEPHLFVNDEPLKPTDYFTYPGSTLSREANIDVEVNNRLSKANSAFGRKEGRNLFIRYKYKNIIRKYTLVKLYRETPKAQPVPLSREPPTCRNTKYICKKMIQIIKT